mgnify:CR=1 FL=1
MSKVEYIRKEALRFGDGVLQHTVSVKNDFPEQAWADTLFMAAFFLLRVGAKLKDRYLLSSPAVPSLNIPLSNLSAFLNTLFFRLLHKPLKRRNRLLRKANPIPYPLSLFSEQLRSRISGNY